MNIKDTIIEKLNGGQVDGLHKTLGMQFFPTDDPDTCMARMKVDKRHVQGMGYINGGATLALAETVAGVASISLCPDRKTVGMNVSCSHIHSAKEGSELTAVARIAHKGSRTHVWNVTVTDENDVVISQITVTNMIL